MNRWAVCCLLTVGMLLLVFGILGVVVVSAFSYPWHASCEINWQIDLACSTVHEKLLRQIDAWSQNPCPGVSESCPKMPCGQKCKYAVAEQDVTEDSIKATHTTPKHGYIDYLHFEFQDAYSNDSCNIRGYSTSGVWYALLDMGTNYCNLRNLIDGAGLDKSQRFIEETNVNVCTQLDVIDCSRF